jgi:aminoglycoside phosphotransferase (APT) family kinase protein
VGEDDIASGLGDFLARQLGCEGAEVRDLRRLSGGASRQTWSFELFDALDGTSRPLILQRVRAGTANARFTMEGEAGLLRAAADGGVPVAPVVAASDDRAVMGAPFLVMGHVEGETIARRILRDERFAGARAALVAQSAVALAGIHRIPLDAAAHLRGDDPVDQLRGLLDLLGQPHPAFELGLRWLDAHRPEPGTPVVVHGDFRLGNLMVDDHGLAAVLDWELAHLGDPVEDLGWLCVRAWRFGSDLPVAGVGEYDQLIEAYRQASGRVVEPAALRWWEALGTLRWGLICVLQASGHLSGASRSVELAAIGRRVCENEYDLLDLIGARRSTPAVAAPDEGIEVVPPALHDAPSAAQLVEAVREFLEGDVMGATEGRVRFHAQVAARVLATVERELAAGSGPVAGHAAALARVGFADDAQLAAGIRSLDPADEVPDQWVRLIWQAVLAKVRVANPGYLRNEDGPVIP